MFYNYWNRIIGFCQEQEQSDMPTSRTDSVRFRKAENQIIRAGRGASERRVERSAPAIYKVTYARQGVTRRAISGVRVQSSTRFLGRTDFFGNRKANRLSRRQGKKKGSVRYRANFSSFLGFWGSENFYPETVLVFVSLDIALSEPTVGCCKVLTSRPTSL